MIIQLLMILQLLIIFICEKEERNVDFLFIVLFSFLNTMTRKIQNSQQEINKNLYLVFIWSSFSKFLC